MAASTDDASPLLKCMWNVPCCGGFCAPTINPDPTCAKHFSNEFTLPCGQAKFMQLSPWIEHSKCCIACGKLGLKSAEPHRKSIFGLAFGLSFFAWILLAYCLSALSTDLNTVKRGYWTKGRIQKGSGNFIERDAYLFVSTSRIVQRVKCTFPGCSHAAQQEGFTQDGDTDYFEKSKSFDDFCNAQESLYPGSKYEESENKFCQNCKDQVASTVTLVIMGFVTQVPQMTTDLQRLTRFGDVNCQSTMGFVTSLISFLSTMSALVSFNTACYEDLPSSIRFESNGAIVATNDIDWSKGPVLICMTLATILKFFDAVLHLLVPSPSERWQKPASNVQTTEDYLMLAEDGKGGGSSKTPMNTAAAPIQVGIAARRDKE